MFAIFSSYRKLDAALTAGLLTFPMLLACQIVIRSVADTKIPSISISDQDMMPTVLISRRRPDAPPETGHVISASLSCCGLNTHSY